MDTIFYAWQSDVGRNVNHYLIRDALKQAIETLNREGIGVEYDEATCDVTGAERIPDKVAEKIDRCVGFVADISIVAQCGTNPVKYSPNPNVMYELGYAAKTLETPANITFIYNEAFCQPNGLKPEYKAVLPFDIGFHRILGYNLPDSASSMERKKTREEMAKSLVADLRKKVLDVRKRPRFIEHKNIPYAYIEISQETQKYLEFCVMVGSGELLNVKSGVVENGSDVLLGKGRTVIRARDRYEFPWETCEVVGAQQFVGGFLSLKAPPEKVFATFLAVDARTYRVEYNVERHLDQKKTPMEYHIIDIDSRKVRVKVGNEWADIRPPL